MTMALDFATLYGLDGKAAIVTGAAQGMGEAFARNLAAAGVSVALADINQPLAERIAAEIGGSAAAIGCDMADEAQVVALVRLAREKFGRVDILVNCAGVQDRNFLEDITTDYWDHVHDVNLRGPMIATREVVRVMRADGTRGAIVNIASNSAFHATAPSLIAYAASKAGVVALTRGTAMEVAKDGIRANAVLPGNTTTPGQFTSTGPAFPDEVVAGFMPAIGRPGTPQDIAAAVLFLASDAAAFITGQTLVVDGGQLTC
jgi:NAD(P)-dependent dehydrogenase (short-subunit alcohol dehydrogenase family)